MKHNFQWPTKRDAIDSSRSPICVLVERELRGNNLLGSRYRFRGRAQDQGRVTGGKGPRERIPG